MRRAGRIGEADGEGCRGAGAAGDAKAVTVSAAAVNEARTAAFASVATDLTASFDGSGSSDPDGAVAAYAWAFGDGATSTLVKPDHTYAAGGTYR